MDIIYSNKTKIKDLYLHDFTIKEFSYNDLDKNITMVATSGYLKKKVHFRFLNVIFCEIIGIEKWGNNTDIIDWYDLPEENKLINPKKNIKPVGIAFVKASMDTIKIYCEKIEFEEQTN